MFRGKAHIWQQYEQDILAVNSKEAAYMLYYLSFVRMSRCYLKIMEVADLQRYKLLRKPAQIKNFLLLNPQEKAFMFLLHKN
jgi:hypothetical protein